MPYDLRKFTTKMDLLGMTQDKLAGLAGVSPATVSNVLSGKFQHRPTIKKIAEALGIPMSELVIDESEVANG